MQPTTQYPGRLFPDKPQQQSMPRFASNVPQTTQAYEPQPRMQQTGNIPVIPMQNTGSIPVIPVQNTGSIPVIPVQNTGSVPVVTASQYTSGSLRALHGTLPVSSMPPLSTMPTAQQYQAQYAPQALQQMHTGDVPVVPMAETPVMVHTIQGAPVVVSLEEMQKAIEAAEKKSGKKSAKKQENAKERKAGRKSGVRFSVMWFLFGVIGILATLYLLLKYGIIPLLVYLLGDVSTISGGGV